MDLLLAILGLVVYGSQSHAEYKYGFADISVNRLIWTSGTKLKSTKQDFNYFELEGGAAYSWGDVYGFFDIENVGKTGNDVRTAAKVSVAAKLMESPLHLYAQVYNFAAAGFSEQNQVVGLSYSLGEKNWWFKPLLGFHEVTQTYFNGFNGYMAGWVLGYLFNIGSQSFMFADWHEFEFARTETYAAGNGGSKTSHNGAVTLWWNASTHWSTGIQWRYASDKLGTAGTLGAEIFTLRYSF